MRLNTVSLLLFRIAQCFPFVHTSQKDDIVQGFSSQLPKWRKYVCSICFQFLAHPKPTLVSMMQLGGSCSKIL